MFVVVREEQRDLVLGLRRRAEGSSPEVEEKG